MESFSVPEDGLEWMCMHGSECIHIYQVFSAYRWINMDKYWYEEDIFNRLLTWHQICCRMLWTVSPVTFFFLLFLSFLLRCSLYHLLQVILVGSSINERDQMLFISTDEGSSFQRQSIDFTPDTLIFHPKEEDKLLAYCKEGRVGCRHKHKRNCWFYSWNKCTRSYRWCYVTKSFVVQQRIISQNLWLNVICCFFIPQ